MQPWQAMARPESRQHGRASSEILGDGSADWGPYSCGVSCYQIVTRPPRPVGAFVPLLSFKPDRKIFTLLMFQNAHHPMYQNLTQATPRVQNAELLGRLRGLCPVWAGPDAKNGAGVGPSGNSRAADKRQPPPAPAWRT